MCPAGQDSSASNSISCAQCPPDKYRAGGETHGCQSCSLGITRSDIGNANGVYCRCPIGEYQLGIGCYNTSTLAQPFYGRVISEWAYCSGLVPDYSTGKSQQDCADACTNSNCAAYGFLPPYDWCFLYESCQNIVSASYAPRPGGATRIYSVSYTHLRAHETR